MTRGDVRYLSWRRVAASVVCISLAGVGAASCATNDDAAVSGTQVLPDETSAPTVTTITTATTAPTADAGVPSLDVTRRLTGTDERSGVRYDVVVPQLRGIADEAAVNARLEARVRDDLRRYLDIAGRDGVLSVPEGAFAAYTVEASAVLLRPEVVSLRLDVSDYAGGAHGGARVVSITVDPRTGRDLALSDLFAPGTDVLATIAPLARAQLRQWFADHGLAGDGPVDDETFAAGTGPTAENYGTWFPTAEGLLVVFGQYQVGPYAIGMPEVLVPWSQLRPYLDADGPVAALAASAAGR